MAAQRGRHARPPFRFDDAGIVVHEHELLSRYTTYRIGGPARYLLEAASIPALERVLGECSAYELPWTVMGKGSNMLVADDGYEGAVIVLTGVFKKWTFDADRMVFRVGGGATLARIVQEAFRQAVSGLEFAVGTPGTVGGALRMNAGTADEWIGSRVSTFKTFTLGTGVVEHRGEEVEWGYRSSSIADGDIVIECTLGVDEGSEDDIRGRMEGALSRRRRVQPLTLPSCGSVFKNPEGESAGALIDRVGLKGCVIGGAQISEKHANFIVNVGGAKASDVLALMRLAQERVEEAYGIELQPEVRFLGLPQQ